MKRQRSKVDPELVRQLDRAAQAVDPVQAVFTLRTSGRPLPPDRVTSIVHQLVERASAATGQPKVDLNVFSNLGAFAISAPPDVIRTLLAEPEIATATANLQPNTALIPPRRKRPVK